MEYRKTKRPVAFTRSTGDGLQFKLPSDAMLVSPWHQIGRSQGLSILGRHVDWHGLGASQLGRLEQIHWVLAYFFSWVLGKKSSSGLALIWNLYVTIVAFVRLKCYSYCTVFQDTRDRVK
ncbi:hypothetical protein ACFX13_012834 [Malus domestica]|uniref:Uncharacterized protein n=1 Tax=Malus domestica TaxID=3750 RepID=A0A498I819_MALDO|nr:hypothetical protein DVH24_001733 [Malus domestica]